MAGVLVHASIIGFRPLIGKLSNLLAGEYNLLKGVRREIKFLHRELSSMDAMLRRLVETELNVQTFEWGSKVRDLSCGIEDCIDVFVHHLDRGDADEGFMRGIVDQFLNLRKTHKIGKQIKALKARVIEESKRHKRYDLGQGHPVSMGRLESSVDARLSVLYGEARGLVGIERPRDKIMHLLNGNEKELKVVSIVGPGGLGKTTLAVEVYNRFDGDFQCRASSYMSSTPDLKRLMKDILSQVNPVEFLQSEALEKEQLIRKVKEYLQHRRYLIVIDDIWSTEAWDSIQCIFPQNDLGSRIITTTRIEHVAAACCYYLHGNVYRIEHLDNQDSRRLFFRRVFNSEDTCPEHFVKVSEEILNKCGGVPLAIISIASMLASQEIMVRTKWEMTLNSLGSMLEENPALRWMNHVLNLSYNDLPHDLKTCMLYLVTFLEDSIIRKDHLCRRWIAEGFVMERPGKDIEDVAEGYFTELINRSMIQPAGFTEGGELVSCRVHDLMLEFIISKSKQENFISTVDDQNARPESLEIRRLSIHVSNIECDFVLRSVELKQTRSLIFSGPAQGIPSLSKFELLRVMDLNCNFKRQSCYDLTGIICRFFLLRYLRVKGNSFIMPKQIGSLKYLKTLELDGNLLDVPSDVFQLQSLSHLIVPSNAQLTDGIGSMKSLRTLRALDIAGCSVDTLRGLSELTQLRELELSYQIHDGRQTPDAEREGVLMASLVKVSNSGKLQSMVFSRYSWCVPYDLLANWDPAPRSLDSLHLLLCPFYVMPAWIAYLDSLTSLSINVRKLRTDGVQILGKLPSLFSLKFAVLELDERRIIISGGAFPALKKLDFASREDTPRLYFEPEAMPKLQNISLEFFCSRVHKAEDLPSGMECLSSLRHVLVYYGSPREKVETIEHQMKILISKHAGHPCLVMKQGRGVIHGFIESSGMWS